MRRVSPRQHHVRLRLRSAIAMKAVAIRLALLSAILSALMTSTMANAETLPENDPRVDVAACRTIATGAGPHSLLAMRDGSLLISSHDRRRFESTGTIQRLNNDRISDVARFNEPNGLGFRPHHMALQTLANETRLWLINHDSPSPNSRDHSLLVYVVKPDGLHFREQIKDPLLSSPNHLVATAEGDVYVSNDRRDGSSVLELALKQSKATIVHWRPGQPWRVVASGLSFTNGIAADSQQVFAVTTFGNQFLSFPRRADGSLGSPRTISTLAQPDGITMGLDKGTYFTASHGPLFAFLRHQKSSKNRSSSVVYSINPSTGEKRAFFVSDGKPISAISSAVIQKNTLYLGQGFDAFVMACPLR